MADESTSEKRQDPKKKPKRFPNKNYAVKKRLPVRPIDGENVVFITKKTSFKVNANCICNFYVLIEFSASLFSHILGPTRQML